MFKEQTGILIRSYTRSSSILVDPTRSSFNAKTIPEPYIFELSTIAYFIEIYVNTNFYMLNLKSGSINESLNFI